MGALTEGRHKACPYLLVALRSIAEEIEEDPQLVLQAPHTTRITRLNEATAARKPILRWKP